MNTTTMHTQATPQPFSHPHAQPDYRPRQPRRNYIIGHPAVDNPRSTNQYEECVSVFGVYASLWERGVPPLVCASAVRALQQGMVYIVVPSRVEPIEVRRVV